MLDDIAAKDTISSVVGFLELFVFKQLVVLRKVAAVKLFDEFKHLGTRESCGSASYHWYF
mgnify:FL=1